MHLFWDQTLFIRRARSFPRVRCPAEIERCVLSNGSPKMAGWFPAETHSSVCCSTFVSWSGRFGRFGDAEVRAIGMLEHQRADAGFRIHHEALGKLHADLFGPQ
jgi:hypothetical protein